MWEIVRFLLAGTTDLPVIEKDVAMLEDVLPEDLEAQVSPRPINTHYHFDRLPPEFFSKKVKIIYMTRDPRDVAVSFFNHHKRLAEYYKYDGEWKNYLPMFKMGNGKFLAKFDNECMKKEHLFVFFSIIRDLGDLN